jgi:hypothetical protein
MTLFSFISQQVYPMGYLRGQASTRKHWLAPAHLSSTPRASRQGGWRQAVSNGWVLDGRSRSEIIAWGEFMTRIQSARSCRPPSLARTATAGMHLLKQKKRHERDLG